jgi:hypothetical protein
MSEMGKPKIDLSAYRQVRELFFRHPTLLRTGSGDSLRATTLKRDTAQKGNHPYVLMVKHRARFSLQNLAQAPAPAVAGQQILVPLDKRVHVSCVHGDFGQQRAIISRRLLPVYALLQVGYKYYPNTFPGRACVWVPSWITSWPLTIT